MMRDAKPMMPGAVRAIELLLKKDGSEAETEAEATTIIHSDLDADGMTVAKTILHPAPSSTKP